jgi:hypothetical protein
MRDFGPAYDGFGSKAASSLRGACQLSPAADMRLESATSANCRLMHGGACI